MNKYNVRTINKKIIEVDGKLVKNNTVPKAPAWFTAFEIKIDNKFEKIDQRLDSMDQRFDKIDQRLNKIDDILERNNLQ